MDESEPDAGPMRERVPGSRIRLWLLLEADRWVVATIPLGAVFAALVLVGNLDPVPLREAVGLSDPVETLFQAFVTAIITGVTLVVTINQLVLSQELGAVGDQRERMEGAMAYRRDVEDAIDAPVSPPEPATFLEAVVDATKERGGALRESASTADDTDLRDRTDEFVDRLTDQAEAVADRLADAQFGTFGVVSAALDFNYSWKIYEARRLEAAHGTDAVSTAVDDLVEALEFFGSAREHVKTLYFQWALIDLSRTMLYVSVPALAMSAAVILFLDDPGSITGATAGIDNLLWVVAAASTVALVPFAILLSYVLRIATVAKRTLAIGPFVLRSTAHDDGE